MGGRSAISLSEPTSSIHLYNGTVIDLPLADGVAQLLQTVPAKKLADWLQEAAENAAEEKMVKAAIKFNKGKPTKTLAQVKAECGL